MKPLTIYPLTQEEINSIPYGYVSVVLSKNLELFKETLRTIRSTIFKTQPVYVDPFNTNRLRPKNACYINNYKMIEKATFYTYHHTFKRLSMNKDDVLLLVGILYSFSAPVVVKIKTYGLLQLVISVDEEIETLIKGFNYRYISLQSQLKDGAFDALAELPVDLLLEFELALMVPDSFKKAYINFVIERLTQELYPYSVRTDTTVIYRSLIYHFNEWSKVDETYADLFKKWLSLNFSIISRATNLYIEPYREYVSTLEFSLASYFSGYTNTNTSMSMLQKDLESYYHEHDIDFASVYGTFSQYISIAKAILGWDEDFMQAQKPIIFNLAEEGSLDEF